MNEDSNFWLTDEAVDYGDFAISIPSDIPAYEVVYNLLDLDGKVVLDFGCFQGKSARNLLNKGAAKVLGIDSVKNNIESAKKNYSVNGNLDFLYVDEDSFIPIEKSFDATCMTFVHPTISSLDKFKFQIKKINEVMKEDGTLLLLGLHPNSFGKHEFLFYGHKSPEQICDGAPFDNELRLSNGEVLKFSDHYWKSETIKDILVENGFSLDSIYELREDLKGRVGDVLRQSISEVDLDWKDEWKAPLYQVVVARKLAKVSGGQFLKEDV